MVAYEIFSSIIFIAIGIGVYIVDWEYGSRFRAWWHNLTHSDEEQISAEETEGFIHKQPTKRKLFAAVIICLLQSIASVRYGPVNALFELLTVPLEIVAIIVGFYLAPGAYRHWTKRDDLFEWVEEVEGGKYNLWQRLCGGLVGGLSFFKKRPPETVKSPDGVAPADKAGQPEVDQETPGKTPDDIFREYSERHGRVK